ncbi:MAG: protein kinase [Anaerolineales bacterium]|nr:protein kinase [Anaerolineales bacterium]
MTLETGQVLNQRYRVVSLLGKGGFGAVYRAWDVRLKGPCALKENFNTSPAAQKQFEREASMLFNLRHPGLPRVFDSFVVPDQGQYLVMDFIEGEDLRQMLARSEGGLPEAQTLAWIRQVCDALSYMHSQNPPIIHRDIKPANIKITPAGEAMLVDFGIAKLHDPGMETTIGARAVTPGYSPQEQYGQGQTDARSDVYALGATLYALLTGREPLESIERGLGKTLTPPRVINPAISAATEQAILKAMQMLPAERFQSVAEFKTALMTPGAAQAERVIHPSIAVAPLQRAAVRAALPIAPGTRNSNAAILSLLCGILGLVLLLPSAVLILAAGVFGVMLGALTLALGIVAIVSSSKAMQQIRASAGALNGEKLADAGRIMGWIIVGLAIAGLCAFCALAGIAVLGEASWLAPGLSVC